MTRAIVFLPLLFSLFFSLPSSVKALDILVLPTVIDPGMDAWQHVPASSEPTIYPTQQVYRGQPFRMLVLGKDYATDNNKSANLIYSVQIFAPSGSALLGQSSALELYKGEVNSNTFLLLSRQYMTLDFSETDPFGIYRFEVTANDLLAEQQTTTTVELILAPVTAPADFGSPEEFSEWLSNYYRAPDPARAVKAMLQYVDMEPESRMKQAPLLLFLTRVIRNNQFLWPQLKSLYVKSDPEEQKKILLLCGLTGQKDDAFFTSLDPKLSAYYFEAKKIKLPVPTDRPVTEIEIDLLWAEFMATGTIAPIRKLTGALYLESVRGTQEKLDSGAIEMSPDAKARAVLEKVYMSALGSLIYNGERHSLVKQYLGYIYELEDPAPTIKDQLEDILEILQKRSNEEEARKHMEKQKTEP